MGIDPHKQTHTAVAIDALTGEVRGERTVRARSGGYEQLVVWARALDDERIFAVEDCRHVSGGLERHLISRGERAVRVAPKLMAAHRRTDRTFGKSDPIDARAVATAALRHRELPEARLAGPEREIGLLAAHREDLVAERTRACNRLRWLLHDLDPDLVPAKGVLDRDVALRHVRSSLEDLRASVEVSICLELTERIAMHAGVAPLQASSGATHRHRLNRRGNRQLNAALHRIAITQMRMHEPAKDFIARKRAEGMSNREALRCLKRQLARRVYNTMRTIEPPAAEAAA